MKFSAILVLFLTTIFLSFGSGHAYAVDEEPTITISTCQQLQDIATAPTLSYQLLADVDCSTTATWNDHAGFAPIANFSGTFNGNNHSIRNLHINRTDTDEVGMFSELTAGTVENIAFTDAVIAGRDQVGVLAGKSSISVQGIAVDSSTVSGNTEIGGIIGHGVSVHLTNSHFTGSITGDLRVGGLLGYDEDSPTITNSYHAGSITGKARLGGLLGSAENEVIIGTSHNTGTITSTEDDSTSFQGVGGLVGASWKITITQSYNTGAIASTTGAFYVGGLLGCGGLVHIDKSYNTGSVTGRVSQGDFNGVGGIVGSAINLTVTNSYNHGQVSADVTNSDGFQLPVGGIVGFAFVSSITNSYNSGSLVQLDSHDTLVMGGLAGFVEFSNGLIQSIISVFSKPGLDNFTYAVELINTFNVGNIIALSQTVAGGLIGEIQTETGTQPASHDPMIYLVNNWWSNAALNGIGKIFNNGSGEFEDATPFVVGEYEKDTLMEGFKTYSHKVYNTDPNWDFATIWSTVYAGKNYPILAFEALLLPGKPKASVKTGTYSSSRSVTLTSTDATKIQYTTNGKTPTCTSGSKYTSKLTIKKTTTVKAIGCDVSNNASPLATFTYTIVIPTPAPTAVVAEVTETVTPTVTPSVTGVVTTIPTGTSTPIVTNTPTPTVITEVGNGFPWWIVVLVVSGVGGAIVLVMKKR